MFSYELGQLIIEYKNASAKEDIFIRDTLEHIKSLYLSSTKYGEEEAHFANGIINEFCQVIRVLKEQHKKEEEAALRNFDENFTGAANNLSSFAVYKEGNFHRTERKVPFESDEALLIAFYNHFRNEQKKKLEKEKVQYPPIERLEDLKEVEKVNSTMKDYVARMKTFANGYMYEIPRVDELWRDEPDKTDVTLFIYKHLELILASFNTREEDGSINKQKGNIQSALRKLNEFKLAQEFCR